MPMRCNCSSAKDGCARHTRCNINSNGSHSRKTRKSFYHKNRRSTKTTSSSLRDQFIKTNLDLLLLGIFFAFYNSNYPKTFTSSAEQTIDSVTEDSYASSSVASNLDEEPIHDPVYAILFPWFTQTISIFIYYVISRYLKILPYTAIVFLLGTVIGYVTNNEQENAIAHSASIWLGINGQVILLVFLPGLIFHDSFTINVHLFFQAFWQLIIFAFPMVLGGATLTALVAGYILPYNWSISLCMTFGAILSGTDPIAVAGLLNSAGAPQRLNMHISGESLLNDGSVVVLFNIFSALFFYELDIPGFGEQFTLGEGFAYFFRLSLGGCAIGLAFGLGTVLMLKFLNRRLSDEENVVQVVLLVSSAYLAYFTSEIVCLCSGIMATIACGITIKVLGETFINDHALTLHFWQVTAELLNTLLFVLGGSLWGDITSTNAQGTNAQDWGYLALLFMILIVIRFMLVFGLYPVTARIGIGTNVKESVFMAYGGFRGSVGIALALSLNAQIYNNTDDETYRNDTDKVIFIVGGISVLTLLINGMTSGPLLSALGLAATETTRQRVIDIYRQRMIRNTLQEYVRLLSQERWKGIDHSIIKEHVPILDDFSFDDLMVAVERHKNNTPVHLYVKPHLEHVFPYLQGEQIESGAILSLRSRSFEQLFRSQSYEKLVSLERTCPSPGVRAVKDNCMWKEVFDVQYNEDNSLDQCEDIDEVRLNYLEILRSSYYDQIEKGSLEEHGDLTYSLFQGLDFCEDTCMKGQPLNDWEATKVASDTRVVLFNRIFLMMLRRFKQLWKRERKLCSGLDLFNPTMFKIRFLVRQNLAFVRAHRHAQRIFESQFTSKPLTPAEAQVIEESQAQVRLAEADLNDIDKVDISGVKGHLMCLILLNKSVQYVEKLSQQKLIPEAAASDLLEVLDGYVENVWTCEKLAHDGRLSTSTQLARLKDLPHTVIEEFNILEAIHEMEIDTYTPKRTPRTPTQRTPGTPAQRAQRGQTDSKAIFRQSSADPENLNVRICRPPSMPEILSDGSDSAENKPNIHPSLPSINSDESDEPPGF